MKDTKKSLSTVTWGDYTFVELPEGTNPKLRCMRCRLKLNNECHKAHCSPEQREDGKFGYYRKTAQTRARLSKDKNETQIQPNLRVD